MSSGRYVRRGCVGSAGATEIEARASFLEDTHGGSFAEYLVLVTAVALGALAGWRTFGGDLDEKISRQADCIEAMTPCGFEAAYTSPTGGVNTPSAQGSAAGGRVEGASAPTYAERLGATLDTLEQSFDAIAGGDGRIDEVDLERALGSSDPAVRDAASFLLANRPALYALDVGSGRGDVDDSISLDDVRGLEDSLEDGDLGTILADTAAGRGDRDGDASRDDLEAIIADTNVPPEIRAAAEVALAELPEDDGCSGWSLCQIGDAAGAVASTAWDIATDPRVPHIAVPLGVYDATVGTLIGIGQAVAHPVQTLEGLVYAAGHPYETLYAFSAITLEDLRENPIRAVSEAATSVLIGVATAGAAPAVVVTEQVVSNADTVVQVSEAGQEAQERDVPGFIEAADDFIAPIVFPTAPTARLIEHLLF